MNLRTKLTVSAAAFLLLTAALAAGSFLIFGSMSSNFAAQRSNAEEHNLYEDLKTSILDFVTTVEEWSVTGNARLKKQYKERLKNVYSSFARLSAAGDKESVEAIRKEFEELKKFADAVISTEQPVGDMYILFSLRMLHKKEVEIRAKWDTLHQKAVKDVASVIARGENIERQMAFYLAVLFVLSSFAFVSLAFYIRRMIAVPFDDLLKATEKISSGELDYRINSMREDEFGIISKRFDEMVEKLQGSIIKNTELYEGELLREKQVFEAKKRMDILFESVQGGLITLDRDYRIISVNKFIENWANRTAEEMTGKSALDIFHNGKGICPHCAAKITFETGQINALTQSMDVNYAELTSYPIKDDHGNISECIVFMQDITDRVLYHDEMLGLYKEVAQTKDYLESLIDNSADAIVTSDLNGNVTSWNQGAERIFGYTEEDVMGKFLPFIPQFLIDAEGEYTDKIKKGETLKGIETLRQKKDGATIEISLTLSPIKDAASEVIGISGISRDISERKRVEKELVRRNKELSRLFFISSAMRGTLELDRLLRMVLTAVTMSEGLGFNRAILFLVDEKKGVIRGAMGVGPASYEEAWQAWEKLSIEKRTLPELMRDIEEGPLKKDSFLDRLSIGMEIPLDDETVLTHAVKGKTAINVPDVKAEPLADAVLIQQLGTFAYAVVPLISRNRAIGVLWVDNFFTGKPITDEDMKFITGFSNQVASAVESARLFEQVSRAEAELENIFRSISDMVYITDKDYTIKNINKAVAKKIGKPADEIIGRKCYQIFHGMNEPWTECPHHETVKTMKAHAEESEDKYLGGTFLTSTSPVFDPAGEFLGTVHVVRDITEMNSLRKKLAASERMAALGEVAAKVAHEIRNPLVSVGGFARRLEKKLDGNLKEYAGIITREVGRLEDILSEILGFVKESRLAKEAVSVDELLDDVIPLIVAEMRERKIALSKDSGETPRVSVDPDRIREALLNIFNNAIQALTTDGAITVKTYASASDGEDFAVIEISDTGPGIDEKDLPFIFDPFYTTKASGTGLGLAITNRIIEEHGGRVEAASIRGKGTTFRVFLPSQKESRH